MIDGCHHGKRDSLRRVVIGWALTCAALHTHKETPSDKRAQEKKQMRPFAGCTCKAQWDVSSALYTIIVARVSDTAASSSQCVGLTWPFTALPQQKSSPFSETTAQWSLPHATSLARTSPAIMRGTLEYSCAAAAVVLRTAPPNVSLPCVAADRPSWSLPRPRPSWPYVLSPAPPNSAASNRGRGKRRKGVLWVPFHSQSGTGRGPYNASTHICCFCTKQRATGSEATPYR